MCSDALLVAGHLLLSCRAGLDPGGATIPPPCVANKPCWYWPRGLFRIIFSAALCPSPKVGWHLAAQRMRQHLLGLFWVAFSSLQTSENQHSRTLAHISFPIYSMWCLGCLSQHKPFNCRASLLKTVIYPKLLRNN